MEHDPRVGSDADHHCGRMNNEGKGMEHDRQVGSDADHHYDRMGSVACCPQRRLPLLAFLMFAANLRTPRFLFKCLRSKYRALSRRLSLFA